MMSKITVLLLLILAAMAPLGFAEHQEFVVEQGSAQTSAVTTSRTPSNPTGPMTRSDCNQFRYDIRDRDKFFTCLSDYVGGDD